MQQCKFVYYLIVLTVAFSLVSSANILDLFWNDSVDQVEQRNEAADVEAPKTCNCDGPTCMCCVDFNLTYIDLGGPGCVKMKYISQEEGIALNISYGKNLLHSEEVKGPNPKPSCMTLLTNFAQVCARFSDLQPYEDGLRGCLLLEPHLLNEVTASFNIGCFTMGPSGIKLEEVNSTLPVLDNGVTENNNLTDTEDLNEEELLAAVNESAQQGLAFFGNLLGISFGNPSQNSSEPESTTSSVTSSENNSATSQIVENKNKSRKLKTGNEV